ncbi:MAG TPA: nuclear transport factor 2 family protein [Burkholderiaceae bacterium]
MTTTMTTTPDTTLADHLIALEMRLLDPVVRRDPQVVGELLDPAFYEFGRSGVVWHRQALLDALGDEDDATISAHGFEAHELADGVMLLTYHSERVVMLVSKQRALRSSVWVRGADGQWRMRFHQGTPAA